MEVKKLFRVANLMKITSRSEGFPVHDADDAISSHDDITAH